MTVKQLMNGSPEPSGKGPRVRVQGSGFEA